MNKNPRSKLNILVADANPYMATLTAGMLRAIHFGKITVVHSSTEAITALATTPFDALVIDADLTPVDGIELTHRLRADATGRNRRTPVVMVCTEAHRGRIVAARDAGVSEFIRKPMSARILEMRLAQVLAQPRAFIDTPSYAGPDRRRHSREAVESGHEAEGGADWKASEG